MNNQKYTIPIAKHRLGYYCIEVEIDGAMVNMIIDTGSTHSYLDKASIPTLKELWIKKNMTAPSVEKGILNITEFIKVNYVKCKLSILVEKHVLYNYDMKRFNDNNYPINKNEMINGIIGIDILEKCGCVLDCKNKTLTLNNK